MSELIHRIRAILRRRSGAATRDGSDPARPVEARVGLDPGSRRVWVDGVEVIATDPEFKVLTNVLIRPTPAG